MLFQNYFQLSSARALFQEPGTGALSQKAISQNFHLSNYYLTKSCWDDKLISTSTNEIHTTGRLLKKERKDGSI